MNICRPNPYGKFERKAEAETSDARLQSGEQKMGERGERIRRYSRSRNATEPSATDSVPASAVPEFAMAANPN